MININNAVQFQHLLWDHIMQEAHVVVDATCGFRVIIMTLANSLGITRVSELLPKLKTQKNISWCIA